MKSIPTITNAQRKLFARDALALLSQFHFAAIPIAVLLAIVDESYLDEVLVDLQSKTLITVTLSVKTLNLNETRWQRERSKSNSTTNHSRYLSLAVGTLNNIFPDSFPHPGSLNQSLGLERHVASVLHSVMCRTSTLEDIEDTINLALRYSMHIILSPGGGPKLAAKFIDRYFDWSRDGLPRNSKEYIALASKQSVLELLCGSSNVAYRLSLSVVRRCIEVYGSTTLETSHSFGNLAHVCHMLRQDTKALKYRRKALAIRQQLHSEGVSDSFVSVSHFGVGLQPPGYYSAACPPKQALTGWINMLEPDTLELLVARSNMAIMVCYQGHLDEAEAIHQYVYTERRRILGAMHQETLKSRANLAGVMSRRGDHVGAEAGYRTVLRKFQHCLGRSHPDVLKTRTNLARVLFDQLRYKDSDTALVEALPLLTAKFGPRHRDVLEVHEFRTTLLHHQQDFAAARSIASDLFEARLSELGISHSDTQRTLHYLQGLQRDFQMAKVGGSLLAYFRSYGDCSALGFPCLLTSE